MTCPDCAVAHEILSSLPDGVLPIDQRVGSTWPAPVLAAAVPLRIFRFRHEMRDTLDQLAHDAASVVATTGDALHAGQSRASAVALDALITGLAIGALTDSAGSTYEGLHWCTKSHRGCPTRAARRPR